MSYLGGGVQNMWPFHFTECGIKGMHVGSAAKTYSMFYEWTLNVCMQKTDYEFYS